MTARKLLVTNALPYVNGHLHVGHLVGYVQADFWVRFQRMCGNEVGYFCGDDTHGTATMIRAREEGCEAEALLEEMSISHQRDFAGFGVEFDHYGSTHSESNRTLVGGIWAALRAAGRVTEKEVTQFFDSEAGVFLADRFVKGICPRCGAAEQYGDNCEACGGIYECHELTDPRSTLSGAVPELRSAPHYFVSLPSCASHSGIGTSAAQLPISASRFRMRLAISSTSGSTRRSATSHPPPTGAPKTAKTSRIGGGIPNAKSTTSSARTSSTFTRFSGPRC